MNEETIGEYVGKVVGGFVGMAAGMGIWFGDELGFYRAMAACEPMTADDIAAAAGTNPRLTREWLDSQAAAGLIEYDGPADRYRLPPEGAMALADESSPVFMARGAQAFGSIAKDSDRLFEAFRGDGGMPWGDHHPCLFHGTEWFFRTGYRTFLASEWMPALDGFDPDGGVHVADVGCGHGASIIAMADAHPTMRFTGVDNHAPSIDVARARVDAAGHADQVDFEVADAQGYDGVFDLICFFDCLHDMGDPVGAARHARSRLADGGSVMLIEPLAHDDRATNMAENPAAPMAYFASSTACVPNSLSQDVGLGLGAQAGQARLTDVLTEAGFTTVTRVAETPNNMVLQAR